MLFDFNFTVKGSTIPADHNYALYSALCNFNPNFKNIDWQLGTINGFKTNKGLIELGSESSFFIRGSLDLLERLQDLRTLSLGKHSITCELQSATKLKLATKLFSRIAVIKGYQDSENFMMGLIYQLFNQGIKPKDLTIGDRKTIKIKRFTIVGFSLCLTTKNLSDAETLLNQGIGGKRKLGCGVFCKVL